MCGFEVLFIIWIVLIESVKMSTAEAQIGVNSNLQQQDLNNLVNVEKITALQPKPKRLLQLAVIIEKK